MTRGTATGKTAIGLLGAGTVGAGFCDLFESAGLDAVISKVLVRDPDKSRPGCVPRAALSTDAGMNLVRVWLDQLEA